MSDSNIKLDPRAKTGIGVETINGSINDRALALINRLNSVMGYEGIGTKKITDINGNTETLALHNIDTGYDWQGKEAYYYQSSVLRLNEISEKLNSNLEKVKNDITKNITNLFDTLKTKSGSLDAYENALANAQSP
ncbi:MAG: hypothetical protein LW817_04860, partial [Candidatus Caenarcaniphilales bacterium]|nr:hypothetical protein [Candidatus Caenarcaniphilales bacterium]